MLNKNMNSAPTSPSKTENSVSCAILDQQHVAVIRVEGRGNFVNSVPVKKLTDKLQKEDQISDLILDLDHCETMDSTFMGVLAAISMAQVRKGHRKLIIANANEHCSKLLKTLGISNLLELHASHESNHHIGNAENKLEEVEQDKISHADQICHTLEAHRTLVRADGENEVRFQSVIHYLEKTLEEEKDR